MARIQAEVVTGSDGNFDTRQIHRVPDGLYGGMFEKYSLPKSYPKYQSEETEQKFFVWFTLTHDRANQQMNHFSEAIMTIRPKLFYNPETGMKSAYVAFLYAMLGGKVPFEQIVDRGEFDLDEFIGRPAILFVTENRTADKNGNFTSKVKQGGIEPADAGLIAAIKPLFLAKQIEKTEKGLAHLTHPVPAVQDDVVGKGNLPEEGTAAPGANEDSDSMFGSGASPLEGYDDEVPF